MVMAVAFFATSCISDHRSPNCHT